MVMTVVTFAVVFAYAYAGTVVSTTAGSQFTDGRVSFGVQSKDHLDEPYVQKVHSNHSVLSKDGDPSQVSKTGGQKDPPGRLKQEPLTKNKEIATVREKAAVATDLLNSETHRPGALESQVSQQEQELKVLRNRGQAPDQLSRELVMTRSNLDQARQKIFDLERQLATSNLEYAKQRIAELDRQLDAKDKQIMAIRANSDDKDKLRDDLAARTEELKRANQHNLALEHESIRAKEALEKITRRVTDLESQLMTRNAELEQAKHLLADLQHNKAKRLEEALSQGPAITERELPPQASVEPGQSTASKESASPVDSGGPEAPSNDLARLNDDLANELQPELSNGDILRRQIGNKLSLEFATGELFGPGQAVMTQRGSGLLQRIGAVLQKYRYQTVEVRGHTDSTPVRNGGQKSFQENSRLSWARAEQATQALISGGLQADRIMTVGYAAMKPIATNDTEAGRSKNRRVGIIITQWSEPDSDPDETTRRVSKKQRTFSAQKVVHR